MFAKGYADGFVYLVDEQGKQASKHAVTYGKASSALIEIKQGLTLGQEIIISDISDWESHQQIRIN
jgi:hypothetical protein